jgi:hypothetical protein
MSISSSRACGRLIERTATGASPAQFSAVAINFQFEQGTRVTGRNNSFVTGRAAARPGVAAARRQRRRPDRLVSPAMAMVL